MVQPQGFASGIAAGVQGFMDYDNQRRRNEQTERQLAVMEQQDLREQSKFDTEQETTRYRESMSNIAQSDLYNISDKSSQDFAAWVDANNGDKNIAALSNTLPKYNQFQNEQGEQVGARVTGYRKNEDGTYTPMVQRLDTGAIVPMTQNRTAESDDMIVTLDRATLNRQLRGRWEEGITKGGLINNQGILAAYDPGTYRADHLRGATVGAILDGAANIPQLANDPKSKTEFAAMINSIDDINELGSYYEAINGEGSFQEFQAAAEEEAKDAFYKSRPKSDPNVPGSTAKLLADNGITKEKWDSYSKEQRSDVLATLKKKKGVQVLARDTAGLATAKMADLVAGNWNDMVDWADEIRGSTTGRAVLSFLGLQDIDWEKPADRSSTPYEDDVRAAQKEAGSDSGRSPGFYQRLGDPQLTANQVESVLDNQPPKWVADPKAVKQAIINETADPTQDQVTQINKLLTEKNIDSTPKLQQAVAQDQITPADALTAAWVVAMTTEGDTQKKVNAYQSLVNFVERGATDLTKYQAESLDDAKEKNMIAWDRQNYNWQQLKTQNQRNQDKTAKQGLEEADAFQKSAYKIFGLNPEKDPETGELDFEFEPTDEQLTEVARLFPGYRLKLKNAVLANQPVRANTLLQGMNPVLSLYLQGRADENQGWFDSLWTEDIGTGQLGDFDLTRVRIAKTDDDGLPTHIAYLDAGGAGQAGDTVKISDIRKDDKWVADLLTQAAVTNDEKIAAGD